MKYLKRFNESLEDDWDLEEIGDIFQDVIDEGFKIEDVHIGNSLPIAPKLWCNSHHDFTGNKSFKSLTIKFDSTYKSNFKDPKYDLSFLDILDEAIKHFESFYGVKLESIYTVGLPTGKPNPFTDYSTSGIKRGSLFNWFNSCETIRDINKVRNEELKRMTTSTRLTQSAKDDAESEIDKLTLTRFDLTFDITKT